MLYGRISFPDPDKSNEGGKVPSIMPISKGGQTTD
jgi:hypothetical protein